ncbi:MAG TPA: RNA methyltransferase [Armatimonadota bacterium]|nr:RNA methyltransferase [Armatimonadota bacterium]HQK96251.1 RNA methyltransferase [Armatimonadota bacterium]
MPSERRADKIARVLASRQHDLHVVLDDIYHPHNISALLRTCDGAGVGCIHIIGETLADGVSAAVSRGCERWSEIEYHDNIAECYARLHWSGFRVWCTGAGRGSIDYRAVDLTQKVAIVLGNERRGASGAARALADGLIWIPMLGMVESLNVSVAGGVILFEALRQRGLPPVGQPVDSLADNRQR